MAYTVVRTVATGDGWGARDMNKYVRDNFAAGVPGIFTQKGQIAAATGADVATTVDVGTNGMPLKVDLTAVAYLGYTAVIGASAYHASGDLTGLAGATWHNTAWDTEEFDTNSAFTTSETDAYYTIPKAGYWLVRGAIKIDCNGATWDDGNESFWVGVFAGATLKSRWGISVMETGTDAHYISGADVLYFDASDVVRLKFRFDNEVTGHTGDVLADSNSSRFQIVYLGA